MARWTVEARQQQRERILALKPWVRSTGPRTPEGKAKVALNRQESLDRIKREIEAARSNLRLLETRLAKIKGQA